MKIIYATSNKNKLESASKYLSSFEIQVEGVKNLDIFEIQTDDIEEISLNKAKQAFEQIKKPLIVSDSGWYIPVLNGFPGPNMNYVNKCFTSEDFLNLMKDKKDKTIILKEYITYTDGNAFKIFKQELPAIFLDKAEGKGTSLDRVISFNNNEKSLAKCRNENIKVIEQRDMWNELGEYLLKTI